MAWTKAQKATAVMACRAAGIDDERRRLLLRQLYNAFYDRDGNKADEPTSTSPRLNNADYEYFLAVVERFAGGQIELRGKKYARCYWQRKAADVLHRMRFKISQISQALESQGLLEPDDVGLAGWIEKRVARGETDKLEQLDFHRLRVLIIGLMSYARTHGVRC